MKPTEINQTYNEVCQEISDWLKKDTNNKVNLTAKEIFELDEAFPALAIFTFKTHLDNGQNATDVLLSDEYCAKLIIRYLEKKNGIK